MRLGQFFESAEEFVEIAELVEGRVLPLVDWLDAERGPGKVRAALLFILGAGYVQQGLRLEAAREALEALYAGLECVDAAPTPVRRPRTRKAPQAALPEPPPPAPAGKGPWRGRQWRRHLNGRKPRAR